MRFNTLILTLSFALTLLMGFFVYKLNNHLVSLDLLFLDIETNLGKVVLFSVLAGFFITFFFEVLYSLKKTNKNN